MLGQLYSGTATLQGQGSDTTIIVPKGFMASPRHDSATLKEEHAVKDLNRIRPGVRAPRRSQTHHDYKLPTPPTTVSIHTIREHPQQSQPSEQAGTESIAQPSVVPSVVSSTPRPPEQDVHSPAPADVSQPHPPPVRRPPLPPPRRSYSVMDYVPMPHHHRPSARGRTLLDLPSELHYAIFDFLDPIDSTCLGLASRSLYTIHRRMHGTVPLSARRYGPNELEWAWHLSSRPLTSTAVANKSPPPLSDAAAAAAAAEDTKASNALARLRVRGQAYCRKCGVCRCELHKHIQDWVDEDLEYCSVKQKFTTEAPEDAKPYCYMSVPKDPNRCGRHRVMGTKVVLQ